MQAPADRADDLGQPPLDRHVDVFVVVSEREASLAAARARPVEPRQQRVAVLAGDDRALGEHPRVRARLRDVLRPQAPIEVDRGVQPLEVGVLGLVEARHGRAVYGDARADPRGAGALGLDGRAQNLGDACNLPLARSPGRTAAPASARRRPRRPGTRPRDARSARGRSSSGGSPADRACSGCRASASARITASRSTPCGSWTTNTNQPRRVAAAVDARQLQALDPRQRLAVELGDARAPGEHLRQAPELGDPERAGESDRR